MSNSRNLHQFSIGDALEFKTRLLHFYRDLEFFMLLDSNLSQVSTYQGLCAVGAIDVLRAGAGTAFEKLEQFQQEHEDWIFGYLGYDLKNELEPLQSQNADLLEFPDLQFFVPELVIEISADQVVFHAYEEDQLAVQELLEQILNQDIVDVNVERNQGVLKATDSREEYLEKANNFLKHIQRGDMYEANLCTEFHAQGVEIDPVKAFQDLNKGSLPPFAAYARFQEHHVISASPERYLKKTGSQLLSQPIKGTAPRHKDPVKDEQARQQLFNNQKERSENVMIVDLVRNDLSRIAQKGSVQVSELYGVYSFQQVHHLISSVVATLGDQYTGWDAIKATFPMGSMTGAPKISAMKIIEQTESTRRGVYSGALGYMNPQGDFDLNVVIRTLLYNASRRVVSLSVGSAITASAQPEAEYEECLVKAAALMAVLRLQGIDFP